MAQSSAFVPWATTASETFGATAGFTQSAYLILSEGALAEWPYGIAASRSAVGLGSTGLSINIWVVGGLDSENVTGWTVLGPFVMVGGGASATAIMTALNPPFPPFWGVKVQAAAALAASCTIQIGVFF